MALAAVVLGGLTVARNEAYRSQISIWQDVVSKRPNNPRAHQSLTVNYLAAGDLEKAMASCQDSLRLNPYDANATTTLGLCRYYQGRTREAVEACTRAVEVRPWDDKLRFNLGEVLLKTGRPSEAPEHFREAVRVRPVPVRHIRLATALWAQGERRGGGRPVRREPAPRPRVAEPEFPTRPSSSPEGRTATHRSAGSGLRGRGGVPVRGG